MITKPKSSFLFIAAAALIVSLYFGYGFFKFDSLSIPSAASSINSSNNKQISFTEKLKEEKQLSKQKYEINKNKDLEKLILSLKIKGIKLPERLIDSLSKGRTTDGDMAELISYLQRILPAGEIEFLDKMDSSILTFDEALALYNERAKVTGLNYSQDILNRGQIAYKTANFQQVKSLLLQGAILPDDALYKMARWGNIELAKKLQADGYVLDPTYSNPVTQQNVLGAFVEGFPSKYSIEVAQQELTSVKELLNMGVEAVPKDGGRDALDYAFSRMTPDNVDYKVLIAEELLKDGVVLQKSHTDLLDAFKKEYPNVYAEKVEPALAVYK